MKAQATNLCTVIAFLIRFLHKYAVYLWYIDDFLFAVVMFKDIIDGRIILVLLSLLGTSLPNDMTLPKLDTM